MKITIELPDEPDEAVASVCAWLHMTMRDRGLNPGAITWVPGAVPTSMVYRVWYWDPCNGMGGKSQNKGTFGSRDAAQKFINDAVGEPGSPRRLDPNNWDRDAYSIQEIPVVNDVRR